MLRLTKASSNRLFFIIFFLGLFILDVLNWVQNRTVGLNEYLNWSLYFRGILFLISIYIVFRDHKQEFYLLSCYALVSVLGAALYSINYPVSWFLNIKFVIKFMFPICLYYLLHDLKDKITDWPSLFINLLKLLYSFCALITIIGYLFDIDLLRSYGKHRFGYSPLIGSINETSLFFIIGLLFYYWMLIANKEGGVRTKVMGITFVLSSLVVGTKSIYLFLFMLSIYSVFRGRQIKNIALSSIVLCANITVVFIYLYPFFKGVAEDYNLINSLSSFRYQLIIDKLLPLFSERWTTINYLLGGNNTWEHFVEMDLVDLFSMSGIIGITIILVLYYKSLFNFKNRFGYFIIISFFLIANMSGHFMWSGVNSLYLVMLALLIQDKENKIDNHKVIRQ